MTKTQYFLFDCDMSGVKKSTEFDGGDDQNSYFLILETELNTVAAKESEPSGHGHYQFIIIDIRLEFTSLSDPETLAMASSKEGGIFAEIYILQAVRNVAICINDEDKLPSHSKQNI